MRVLGFGFMYVGVLLYGNLLTLGFSVFAMVMLHLQILQEERYLESAFGTTYTEYKKRFFAILAENHCKNADGEKRSERGLTCFTF